MGSARAVKTALSRAEAHLARAKDAYVPTPEKLAETVTGYPYTRFGVPSGRKGEGPLVLEPSAGTGILARAVLGRNEGARLTVIEPDDGRRAALDAAAMTVHGGTFEEYAEANPGARFDAVIANPPWSLPDRPRVWIEHVLTGWDLLLPGGRLVAVVPGGVNMPGKAGARLAGLVAAHGGVDRVNVSEDSPQAVKDGFPARAGVLFLVKPMPDRDGRPSWVLAPTPGAPVDVAALDVTPHAALSTPVQSYSDWSDGYRARVVRYAGTCITCGGLLWQHDDGREDPQAWTVCNAVDPGDLGQFGPSIGLCMECSSYADRYSRALAAGAAYWTDKPAGAPHPGPNVYPLDLCAGVWVALTGRDYRGGTCHVVGLVIEDPRHNEAGEVTVTVRDDDGAGLGVSVAEDALVFVLDGPAVFASQPAAPTASVTADAVRQVEEPAGEPRNLPALRPECPRPGHGFMDLRPFSGQTLEQLYTGPWYDCWHTGCDNRRCRNSVALATGTMEEYADAIVADRRDPRTVKTRARRVAMFAAKFAADTVSAEPARYVEPTDSNLSAAFAGCSRPPASGLYPEIRALFTATYATAATVAPVACEQLSILSDW